METICGTGIRVSELRYFTVEAVRRGEITVACKSKHRKILAILLAVFLLVGVLPAEVIATDSVLPADVNPDESDALSETADEIAAPDALDTAQPEDGEERLPAALTSQPDEPENAQGEEDPYPDWPGAKDRELTVSCNVSGTGAETDRAFSYYFEIDTEGIELEEDQLDGMTPDPVWPRRYWFTLRDGESRVIHLPDGPYPFWVVQSAVSSYITSYTFTPDGGTDSPYDPPESYGKCFAPLMEETASITFDNHMDSYEVTVQNTGTTVAGAANCTVDIPVQYQIVAYAPAGDRQYPLNTYPWWDESNETITLGDVDFHYETLSGSSGTGSACSVANITLNAGEKAEISLPSQIFFAGEGYDVYYYITAMPVSAGAVSDFAVTIDGEAAELTGPTLGGTFRAEADKAFVTRCSCEMREVPLHVAVETAEGSSAPDPNREYVISIYCYYLNGWTVNGVCFEGGETELRMKNGETQCLYLPVLQNSGSEQGAYFQVYSRAYSGFSITAATEEEGSSPTGIGGNSRPLYTDAAAGREITVTYTYDEAAEDTIWNYATVVSYDELIPGHRYVMFCVKNGTNHMLNNTGDSVIGLRTYVSSPSPGEQIRWPKDPENWGEGNDSHPVMDYTGVEWIYTGSTLERATLQSTAGNYLCADKTHSGSAPLSQVSASVKVEAGGDSVGAKIYGLDGNRYGVSWSAGAQVFDETASEAYEDGSFLCAANGLSTIYFAEVIFQRSPQAGNSDRHVPWDQRYQRLSGRHGYHLRGTACGRADHRSHRGGDRHTGALQLYPYRVLRCGKRRDCPAG